MDNATKLLLQKAARERADAIRVASGKVVSMDFKTTKALHLAGFSYALALIGKFMTLHQEHYGSKPDEQDVTNFCLKLMFNYDGRDCNINNEETKELIFRCMIEAREWRVGA